MNAENKLITVQIAESIYKDLVSEWGREPTWQEFIEASKNGRVRVNKTIAAQAIFAQQVSSTFKVLYGIILMWTWILLVPIIIGLAIFHVVSYWWILGSIFIAGVLKNVAREGHCEGIKDAAERHEDFYENLMKRGAFLFNKKDE